MGPDASGLDAGRSSSEDDGSCFVSISGSDDEGKKGAAGGCGEGREGREAQGQGHQEGEEARRQASPELRRGAPKHRGESARKLAGRGPFRPPVAALARTHA